MTVYIDTSAIIKLYFREKFSRETATWLRKNNEAVPITPFHDLEFTNAVNLKCFRKEITVEQAGEVLAKFKDHQAKGVYYRPPIKWPDVFLLSLDLTRIHTPAIGCRSLDIMHVALALSIGANRLLTFDQKQSQLALAAGLRIETP